MEPGIRLDEKDAEAFANMAHRLELVQLWTELSSMLALGYAVPPSQRTALWRSYPMARVQGQEMQVTSTTHNSLRCVTGLDVRVFTTAQVQATKTAALNMLKVYTHRVEA
jgi:hypothetical protein